MKVTQQLRQMINGEKSIIAPGVYDGMSALLAKRAGFSLIYASGGAIARSAGYPDIGILTMTEVCSAVANIVNASGLPVIADADTGFGNEINTWRTVQEFERLGVAGLHLEDQTFPKRCGHLNDKSLIPTAEMCLKLKIARQNLRDPDFVLIARTDAIAVEGIDAAIARSKAYIKAGADVIFVEAPETLEQIHKIATHIQHPKLINMFYGGKTPLIPAHELEKLGYRIIIIPSDLQRAAIKAMQITLAAIMENGNSTKIAEQLVSFKERELIVETEKYLQMDQYNE